MRDLAEDGGVTAPVAEEGAVEMPPARTADQFAAEQKQVSRKPVILLNSSAS